MFGDASAAIEAESRTHGRIDKDVMLGPKDGNQLSSIQGTNVSAKNRALALQHHGTYGPRPRGKVNKAHLRRSAPYGTRYLMLRNRKPEKHD
jgi:hypothetical protein